MANPLDEWASSDISSPVITRRALTLNDWILDSNSTPLFQPAEGEILTLDDDTFTLEAPYTIGKTVGTVVAAGGTPAYTFQIVSQTLL